MWRAAKNWDSRRLTQPIVNSYYCLQYLRESREPVFYQDDGSLFCLCQISSKYCYLVFLFVFFIISCYCTKSACTSSHEHNSTATATADVHSTTVICKLCLWSFNWLLLWFQYWTILWCKYSGNKNYPFFTSFCLRNILGWKAITVLCAKLVRVKSLKDRTFAVDFECLIAKIL